MRFTFLDLPDVMLIEPHIFQDGRGSFWESYQKEHFFAAGIQADFVQDNHSVSSKGVLRGLHYQIRQAQGKLVRVIAGKVYDVAVDLRHSSPAFGRWIGLYLSDDMKQQLWVPPGFAHGFYVMTEHAEVVYKTTDYYAPEWERTLLWNDPALGIDWPLVNGRLPVLSPKDAAGKPLSEAETYD
jgi:dTDP-4-dehydrorhamnose 3,5-epimerase